MTEIEQYTVNCRFIQLPPVANKFDYKPPDIRPPPNVLK